MLAWVASVVDALPLAPRARRWAGIFLLLAPVAVLLALAMRWSRPAPPPLAIAYERQTWVERSRAAAGQRGYDASNWNASVSVEENENAIRHYVRDAGRDSAFNARIQPAVSVSVRLTEPNGDRVFETRWAASGDLLAWSIEGVNKPASKDVLPDALSQLAQTAIADFLRPFGPVKFTHWRSRSADDAGPGYEGDVEFTAAPGKHYAVQAGARGGNIVSISIQNDSGNWGSSAVGDFEGIVRGIGIGLTSLFLLYSLRLFRRRRREGEIPKERALILVAIFGVCGGIFVALNPESVVRGSGGLATALAVGRAVLTGLGTSLLFAFGGLFVSAAYASGEGEIREGWPGKLISFDAVLSGHWFTKPVGVSAVVAAAIAGWAFFVASCAWRLEPAQAALLIDKDLLSLTMGRNMLVRSLVDLPLRVSFLIVAGLFMPLAFVRRRRWKGWKIWTVLLVCPLLVDAGAETFSLSGIGPLMTALGMVVSLVTPFYLCDVLAAVLGALLYGALTTATQIATGIPSTAFTAGALLIVVTILVLPLMVATWRGHEVDEQVVRPKYARNLAERLSLTAEVSAAREAQVRLLPHEMPQQANLSVAAYCQPARIVGGDFYDFFPAPDGRLGVFVASGSGLGLASALTIALAKGFLSSALRRGESPEQSVRGLLTALSGRVGAAADQTGLLLMVVDPASGAVEMARRGRYPAVWLLRGRECTPVHLTNGDRAGLETGTIHWRGGDALVTNTEGFTALLDDHSLSGQRDWLRVTARRTEGGEAERINLDLTRRLGGRRGKHLRKLRRDLTTVVLRNQSA